MNVRGWPAVLWAKALAITGTVWQRSRQSSFRAKLASTAGVLLIASGGTTIGLAASSQDHAPQPGRAAAGAIDPVHRAGSPAGQPAPRSRGLSISEPWAGYDAKQLKAPAGPWLPRSLPTAIDVPAIGVHSRLLHLGLDSNGAMQVPPLFAQPSQAAWYKYSPTPGQVGPSIIEGHIDTYRGPSVFYRLGALRPGDTVNVTLADGTVAVFRVTAVREYLKSSFPTQTVYGPADYAALRLITCGGDFDYATHSYLGSTVVFAALTSSHSAS
jgi:hypothetical protein